ncbi:TadE/TadG family type IV pilus assembly protein [Bradyrhizobium sp. AUGA SZCCT0431]|uniref:TadE/TadG family type IV pilus assembly protein n=1 Tax=Bradyrhizobium sp. AUGA SZCCT0431 TaxID=2807674 RepID=UPI003908AA3D
MSLMTRIWLRMRRSARDLSGDTRGLAAVEFAMVVPLMLVLFFGTVEFSSGVAVDRKVTLVARTLSDLTSQNTSVTSTQLTNIFNASTSIMTPYSAADVNARIVELYVDANLTVRQIWSATSGSAPPSGAVTVPDALKIAGTYLIYSEVSYKYKPAIGYVMAKGGIDLSDFTYTRPRQSLCVLNPPPVAGAAGSCPTT